MVVLMENVAAVTHLLAMALGLGTVMTTDLTLLSRLNAPFEAADAAALERAHRVIVIALLALWASGLLLLALRTGFRLEAVSAKLAAKLAVVVVLTTLALIMARWAIPTLARNTGRRIASLGLPRRLALGTVAGLSAGSWLFALVLGGAHMLKTADAEVLVGLAASVFGGALSVGIGLLVVAGRGPGVRAGC